MKEEQKRLINYTIWLGIVIAALLCWVDKSQLTASPVKTLLGAASKSVTISLGFAFLYERYFWRYNPLESRPKLAKVYEGELESTFDQTKRSLKLEIKQTLFSTYVRFNTRESQSDALSSEIIKLNGQFSLVYTYLNTPEMQFIERSPMHFGTAILNIRENLVLDGNYFTGRKTTGHMKATATSGKHN